MSSLIGANAPWGRLVVPPRSLISRPFLLLLFGALEAAIFVYPIAGAAITPRWIVLATLPWLFITEPKLNWRIVPLLALGVWLLLTVWWADQRMDALGGSFQMCIALGVVLMGASLDDIKPVLIGFGLGVVPAVFFGWFLPNIDIGGEAAAVVLIGLLAYRVWWPCPFVACAVLYTEARGAILGIGLALVAMLVGHYRARGFIAAVFIVLGVAALLFLTGHKYSSIAERFDIWRDILNGWSWFGHGLNNMWNSYPHYAYHHDIMGSDRPERSHDDLLEIFFDGGVVALVLGLIAVASAFCRRITPETYILVVFIGCSLVGFPLHIPTTLFLVCLALGRIYRRDDVLDTADAGGSLHLLDALQSKLRASGRSRVSVGSQV